MVSLPAACVHALLNSVPAALEVRTKTLQINRFVTPKIPVRPIREPQMDGFNFSSIRIKTTPADKLHLKDGKTGFSRAVLIVERQGDNIAKIKEKFLCVIIRGCHYDRVCGRDYDYIDEGGQAGKQFRGPE